MKTMKKVGILVLVLVTALLLAMMIPSVFAEVTSAGSNPEAAAQEMWRGGRRGGRGGHGGRGGGAQIAEPENAIGKDKAQAAALADAGVTAEQAEGKIRVHTDKLTDGTVVYAVHFAYNNQMYYYQINATTGAVVDKTAEAATSDNLGRGGRKGRGGRGKGMRGMPAAPAGTTANAT